MVGDSLFWEPHIPLTPSNLCLRPLNAVHVAGDRLFWEPHILSNPQIFAYAPYLQFTLLATSYSGSRTSAWAPLTTTWLPWRACCPGSS